MSEPLFRSRWHWEEVVKGPSALRVRVGRTGISQSNAFGVINLLRTVLNSIGYIGWGPRTWTVSVTPKQWFGYAVPIVTEEYPTREAAVGRAEQLVADIRDGRSIASTE